MVLAARWPVGRLANIWRRLWRWRFKKSPYGCRGFNLLGTDIRRFLGSYSFKTYMYLLVYSQFDDTHHRNFKSIISKYFPLKCGLPVNEIFRWCPILYIIRIIHWLLACPSLDSKSQQINRTMILRY